MKTTNYGDVKVVQQYSKKTLAAVYINYPAVLKTVGNVRGKTILDLGCGAGWLASELCRKGAQVFGVDHSPQWIKVCQSNYGALKKLKFCLGGGERLDMFRKGKFDVVIANMVFLSVASSRKVENMFSEISRVMKKRGVFIFSDCHPCSRMMGATGTKLSDRADDFCYFDDGVKYKATYLLSDYTPIEFTDSFWSLGFYSRLLGKNGLVIEEIIEPKPAQMDPSKRFADYRIPEYIVFKCRKSVLVHKDLSCRRVGSSAASVLVGSAAEA